MGILTFTLLETRPKKTVLPVTRQGPHPLPPAPCPAVGLERWLCGLGGEGVNLNPGGKGTLCVPFPPGTALSSFT